MGNYANWDDVVGRYPKVASVGDSAELQESYIAGVEAVMNSHLAKQFTVPIADEPALLKDVCIDLTYAKIMVHKDKAAQDIYDKAMEILKNLADGMLLLLDANGDTISTLGLAAWSTTKDYHDTFTMLGIDDRIDEDLLEDLASERS
jgi:phage gp36-like protein